ncbi:MAG TPA: septation protein SpoVG family protein [Candidatus Woesebacteria bacterium]|nr:septation protein SpoVG family protein [Candidatus Woesebacteria bacterium]
MQNRISEIQVVPVKPTDGLVGFASLVYNDSFYMGSIGIYTRPQGGYRLTYPTRKGANGNFNIFHPINRKVAEEIEKVIISKFEDVTKMYVGHNKTNT